MTRNFSSELVDQLVRNEARIQKELAALVRNGRKFSNDYDAKVRELQHVQSRLYAKTGVA